MPDNKMTQEEALKKLHAFVVAQMKAGVDKIIISQKLVEMGVDSGNAAQLVDTIHSQVMKVAEKEQFTFNSIVPALFGGIVAAALGGALWGLIVISTGYVIGYMAVGLGLLSGYAVLLFSKGKKGIPLQVIAVLSSLLGIVVGKYFTFFHFLKEAVTKRHGEQVASELSVFSEKVVQVFLANIDSMLRPFDILWVILAVVTAWKIPQGLGISRRNS